MWAQEVETVVDWAVGELERLHSLEDGVARHGEVVGVCFKLAVLNLGVGRRHDADR